MAGRKLGFPERAVKPEDTLVVVGSIGQVGIRTLLTEKQEWFSPWFSPSYLERVLLDREKLLNVTESLVEKFGITGIQAVDEGGILRAIWDLSGENGAGVSFALRRIPVKQYVIELCERCSANPYRLWCGNCFLLAVRRGWQLARALKEQGMEAEVIGAVQEGIARKIHDGEGTGYLERPKEDELIRLLGREGIEKIRQKELGREKTAGKI